jgi:hypothetical protein
MAADPPKPDPRVIAAYLDDVDLELVDHDIALLADELSQDDPWRTKFRALEPLSSYATTYRYPSPMGKRKGGPSNDEVLVWIKTIAALTGEARATFVKGPT